MSFNLQEKVNLGTDDTHNRYLDGGTAVLSHRPDLPGQDRGGRSTGGGVAAGNEVTSKPLLETRIPAAPSLSLPKGGGAIQGIGEKFNVNPSNGTGQLSIPIKVAPGRSGMQPNLSLSYDSGAGNGEFGLGWRMSGLDSITRKTSKGLPQYNDHGSDEDSDVFLLAGSEDLVPLWKRDQAGSIIVDSDGQPAYDEMVADGYVVRAYAPRIVTVFNRIERWTSLADREDMHWRVISPENVTTIFGPTESSRIYDISSASTGTSRRIFSWLQAEVYDSHGNAMTFSYKREDAGNVALTQAHELNRSDDSRRANLYLKTIRYGNVVPNRDPATWEAFSAFSLPGDGATWKYSVVLDYGEHSAENPTSNDSGCWTCRCDPFSRYNSGFEIRTYRLCRRVLVFHHFEELGGTDYLVSSVDFAYQENPTATYLVAVDLAGYSGGGASGRPPFRKNLPPVEFEYSYFPSQEEFAALRVEELDPTSMENLPIGLDGTNYQWIDLDGEGVSGILAAHQNSWYYKRNTSPSNYGTASSPGGSQTDNDKLRARPRLGPLEVVDRGPFSTASVLNMQFGDVNGNGKLDLISHVAGQWGYYERDEDETLGWTEFRPFRNFPNIQPSRAAQFIDLTGDGLADIILCEDQVYTWFPSEGPDGYGAPQTSTQSWDEKIGPVCVFADSDQSIYLADMSGDGLVDICRIRNGECCYWPNLGYGKFGPQVFFDNAPWSDYYDQFDHSRVHLTDVDGSGTADIVYLRNEGVDIYTNQSGNSFSERKLVSIPFLDNSSVLSIIDLLGNGTQCLVCSSPLPCDAPSPMRYVDIFRNKKPHLLTKVTNNLGSETCIHYAPSTKFYVEDNRSGQPWITRLPFPVQCVESVETFDSISGNRFVTSYRYAHGFYDGVEREFRGFARVEQTDTSNFETHTGSLPTNAATAWNVPPVRAVTWFHTGAYFNNQVMSELLSKEYFSGHESHSSTMLQHTIVPPDCTEGAQQMEACRALKGRVLRVEVYSDDASNRAHIPYSVQETNFTVLPTQPIQDAHLHGVYHVHPRESVSCAYERVLEDPRVSHQIVLEVDAFGNVLKDLHIAYGRQPGQSQLEPEHAAKQETTMVLYQETDYTNSLDGKHYRNPVPSESRQYEIRGLMPDGQTMWFVYDQLVADSFSAILSIPEVPFEDENSSLLPRRRLLRQERMLYRADDLSRILSPSTIEPLCLPGAYHTLVFTPGLFRKLFTRQRPDGSVEPLISTAEALDGKGYVDLDMNGSLWTSSATASYAMDSTTATAAQELGEARRNFFLPKTFVDPFGNQTHVDYDRYVLFPIRSWDAVDNTVSLDMDYRVLQPAKATDPNGNLSTTAYDAMGQVAGTAVSGKPSDNIGDTLEGFEADLSQGTLDAFLASPTPAATASLLGKATSRVLCDYQRVRRGASPVYQAVISRETHVNFPPPPGGALFQVQFKYSDGFGRVIQTKTRTKPGPVHEGGVETGDRWIGSGWVIFNNKGKPVKQFEPFFDDTAAYQPNAMVGVSSILLYDPLGRAVAVIRPDHAVTKTIFSPWHQRVFDENDNVLMVDPRQDLDVGHLCRSIPEDEFLPSWYEARVSGDDRAERDAASKTVAHSSTPTTSHLDSLGRPFLVVASTGSEVFTVSTELDVCGNPRVVRDGLGRTSQVSDWDMCQRQAYSATIDSGQTWAFSDGASQKCMAWNSRDFRFRYEYDELRRQTRTWWRDSGTVVEVLTSEIVYGEAFPISSNDSPETQNLRGKVWQIKDQSGLSINVDYDWDGNLTKSRLRLAANYKEVFSVSSEMALEDEEFVNTTSFDAVSRPIRSIAPDGTITCRVYNQSTRLDRMHVNAKGELDPNSDPTTWRPIFTDVQYNPKGQVTSIAYGNGTRSTRTYDKFLSRLQRLRTTRADGQAIQDLTYTYDPVGNISHIEDAAQQTVFFRNTVVDSSSSYWYDAVYRLVSASGREHLGQTNGRPDSPRAPTASDDTNNGAGDGNAMGRYTETYNYDLAGNLLLLRHEGSDSQNPGWTRLYSYHEPSALKPEQISNRLSQTSVGSTLETYGYNGSAGLTGNMTSMTHLPLMCWDLADRLKVTSKQRAASGSEQVREQTYYVYNDQGIRIRKVVESQAGPNSQPVPLRIRERIYLGEYEIFRKYSGTNHETSLERTTYHACTENEHLADICDRTAGNDMGVQHQVRFQLHNHLGSSTVELDDVGALLSYEEFFHFGSSSYKMLPGRTDVAKRFRFTGKELDDENGLYYHGARYYAAWLGRWTAADPVVRPGSPYDYASNNPVRLVDLQGREPTQPPLYFLDSNRFDLQSIKEPFPGLNPISAPAPDTPSLPFPVSVTEIDGPSHLPMFSLPGLVQRPSQPEGAKVDWKMKIFGSGLTVEVGDSSTKGYFNFEVWNLLPSDLYAPFFIACRC
ncbi:hypothetical protein BFJ68_g16267 [Fusarium oxysporum]|uniref:Insecticide toxin TcdB middle/N-terminal domain-containing protein n=1 Tax=Fusarium oxysporum TaxID=5507 RepID=A0A420PF36_FUSOX|nr:hypothetical protein BFJ71_g15124 [Fusarium oxysporum]RKK91139.1 hypothetical protein BFJ68_g16267 [Fusarium oxysporum]